MEGLVIVVVLFAPPFLVSALRKTALWWVPGVALAVLGCVVIGSIKDTHGDVGGVAAMGNGFAAIGGMLLFGYAILCFAVPAIGRHRAMTPRPAPQEPVELPPVTVVKDLSNS